MMKHSRPAHQRYRLASASSVTTTAMHLQSKSTSQLQLPKMKVPVRAKSALSQQHNENNISESPVYVLREKLKEYKFPPLQSTKEKQQTHLLIHQSGIRSSADKLSNIMQKL
jgi:hypothetical protein